MMQIDMKKAAACAALEYVHPGNIIGVGTGTTVDYFIQALATKKHEIKGAVSSSIASTKQLQSLGVAIIELNDVDELPVYIDGADTINSYGQMLKGRGSALTREKIIATASKQFICITDSSKHVDLSGEFPLPVEVIPMARNYVARELMKLGGDPVYRAGTITDNGNIILDVYHLSMLKPKQLELRIDCIAGVLANGLFAQRSANIALKGTEEGVKTLCYACDKAHC